MNKEKTKDVMMQGCASSVGHSQVLTYQEYKEVEYDRLADIMEGKV